MTLDFLLIAEGSSDLGLIPHLEALCVEFGAAQAAGRAPELWRLRNPPGRAVRDKVSAALQLESGIDFIAVHRDSDGVGRTARVEEIRAAVVACGCEVPVVSVVPEREMEAWLLLDEAAIRRVAGNPGGRQRLSLPATADVESVVDPKGLLRQAMREAHPQTGRRRQQQSRDFPLQRQRLLESLDRDGPIRQLPSWRAMCDDLQGVVSQLRAT